MAKLSNINKPTSAKWSKLGMAILSVSTFISGYGLTQNDTAVGFVGLVCGIVGTFIINLLD